MFTDQQLTTKVSSVKHKTSVNTYSIMASNCEFKNMKWLDVCGRVCWCPENVVCWSGVTTCLSQLQYPYLVATRWWNSNSKVCCQCYMGCVYSHQHHPSTAFSKFVSLIKQPCCTTHTAIGPRKWCTSVYGIPYTLLHHFLNTTHSQVTTYML